MFDRLDRVDYLLLVAPVGEYRRRGGVKAGFPRTVPNR